MIISFVLEYIRCHSQPYIYIFMIIISNFMVYAFRVVSWNISTISTGVRCAVCVVLPIRAPVSHKQFLSFVQSSKSMDGYLRVYSNTNIYNANINEFAMSSEARPLEASNGNERYVLSNVYVYTTYTYSNEMM